MINRIVEKVFQIKPCFENYNDMSSIKSETRDPEWVIVRMPLNRIDFSEETPCPEWNILQI